MLWSRQQELDKKDRKQHKDSWYTQATTNLRESKTKAITEENLTELYFAMMEMLYICVTKYSNCQSHVTAEHLEMWLVQ